MRFRIILLAATVSASPVVAPSTFSQETEAPKISVQGRSYPLYPMTMTKLPDLPSPYVTEDGDEFLVAYHQYDQTYVLIPVTVENGEPLNYAENRWGKGQQLEVNERDFPTLARAGLHSETELERARTITGRSVEAITEDGRPERSSFAGFMAPDEDIISVLNADNRLVKKLGLTHPALAKPLFHLWNIILSHQVQIRFHDGPLCGIDWFLYHGKKVHLLDAGHGHGWQFSIFNDGLLGMFQIEIRRDLEPQERAFLDERYAFLDAEQKADLIRRLSYIHLGEMVAFYIQRYGFYEGHTSYRADPLAIAFIFGLKSIEDIEGAFEGKLYEVLTHHFIDDSR